MNHTPYLIWSAACLAAVVGTWLLFRSEERKLRSENANLRRTVFHLRNSLEVEQAAHKRTRSRLSELMPVDEALDRIVAHERSKTDEVYDQTKDRGPTRRVRTW